jgi:hypothetical protein
MNVLIDLGTMVIPYVLIKKTQLQSFEKRIIALVFAAQSIGTVATYASFPLYSVLWN